LDKYTAYLVFVQEIFDYALIYFGIMTFIDLLKKRNFVTQNSFFRNTHFYIVEYEQHGSDRAEFGDKRFKKMAAQLKNQGVKGLQERNLYLCKDFYKTYPNILQSLTAKSYIIDFQAIDAKLKD
jgi:DUF1016 N-terminal domain